MDRKQILLLSIAALAVGLMAFQTGRQVVRAKQLKDGTDSLVMSRPVPRRSTPTDRIDVTNARISNLGIIGFEQAFDLLAEAGPELRQRWADELEALPAGPRKAIATSIFYKTLSQLDASAAFDLAVSRDTAKARDAALHAVMAAISAYDMPKIAAAFDRIPAKERKLYAYYVVLRWSEVDPVSTSDFVDKHLDCVDGSDLEVFLTGWAGHDPMAARAWLETHQIQSDDNEAVIRGLVNGWCDSDLPGAVEYVVSHESDEEFKAAIGDLSWTLFHRAPDEARSFLTRLRSSAARDAAVEAIARIASAEKIQDFERPPDVIVKWLVAMPAEVWGGRIGQLAVEWARTNRDDFNGWINQLPTEDHDLVLSNYCTENSGELYETVLQAQRIESRSLRTKTLKDVFSRLGDDREKIMAGINELEMSPTEKAALATMVPLE